MPPQLLSTSDIAHAADMLRNGKLVAMPTETVYGLAADATNPEAVDAIYTIKGRPSRNPLITHVSSVEMAQRYVQWNSLADRLAQAFWPGPLTLVLPKTTTCALAPQVTAGLDTAAIRMPDHEVALALITAFNGGLAAPSANRSGHVSPSRYEHVLTEFPSYDLPVLVAPPLRIGIESTVLQVHSENGVQILRPGAILQEQVETIGIEVVAPLAPEDLLLAPGMMLSHYAPSCPVRLNALRVGPAEALLNFGAQAIEGRPASTFDLSESGTLEEAAHRLFDALRTLDTPGVCAIAVAPIPMRGIGIAINDRLARAAAERPA